MAEEIFPSEEQEKKDERKIIEEGKAAAILGYIPFMCFVPLIKMKDNPFAVKHGKQGLILFVVEILAVLFLLPRISDFFWSAVIILCAIFAVVGILNAIQGKSFKIPYIGDLGEKIKI
jgi:fumarate reductase subunit D